MNNIKNDIIKDFTKCKQLYDDFAFKAESLIRDLLLSENIKYHQITQRVKDIKKLEGKIVRKDNKYKFLTEITDLVGIRIITYFEDEVDKIANIINAEFEIDPKNSVDKRQLEADKFGYRSLHYVASINKKRSSLREYKKFEGLKIEFQIRTILQHSWAEIEHDIGYKGEIEIPIFAKRTFYRVAALLETADLEFVKLKNLLKEYEEKLVNEIKSEPESVLIDKASLQTFVNTSTLIAEIDREISSKLNVKILDDSEIPEYLLDKINKAKISSIKELEEYIVKNKTILLGKINEAIKDYKINGDKSIKGIAKGIILYQF